MGIFRVGFKDLIRNKGKTIIAIAGILVSIILISGINITTASLTAYNLNRTLSETYVDIEVTTESVDTDNILETLDTVKDYDENVEQIIPAYSRAFHEDFIITTNETINWTEVMAQDSYEYYASINGVDESLLSSERFKDTYEILDGRLPKDDMEIVLDYNTFNRFNLSINDNITIGYNYNGLFSFSNLTIIGTFTFNNIAGLGELLNQLYREENSILCSFDFARKLHVNFTTDEEAPIYKSLSGYITYNFIINHDNLNIFNIEGDLEQVKRIALRIFIEDDADYNFDVNNNLYNKLESTSVFMIYYQLLLLVISIPVYVLGLYLSTTLFNLSIDKQETKIGQFLSKGALKRQIKLWIIFESISYSIIGGILGFLGGYLFSYFFLNNLLGSNFETLLTEVGIYFDPFTILFSIFVAIIFVLIALIKPLKRISKKTIRITSSKQISDDIGSEVKKSKKDWLLLVMGLLPVIFTLFVTDDVIQASPWEIRILLSNLTQFMIGWTAASTFILTYSIVKIITTRYSERFINFSKKLIKPFSGLNYELISRNLKRNLGKTIALIFMISFSFSFLFLSAIVSESQRNFEEEMIYLDVGADIRANCYSLYLDDNLEESIRNSSSHINDVCPVLYTYSWESYLISQEDTLYGISIHGVKPNEYLNVNEFKEKYFPPGTNKDIIKELENTENGVLVENNWAKKLGLLIGDQIEMSIYYRSGPETELKFEVVGFFNVLPGLMIYSYSYYLNLLVNYDYVENTYGISNMSSFYMSYLIDVEDDANIDTSELAEEIKGNFYESISNVRILEEELQEVGNVESYTSAVHLLYLENFFILIIASFGLLVLLYENLSSREVELGVLRARGLEKKDLIKMNFFEGFTVIIYGMIFGLIGLFSAFVMNVQLDNYIYEYLPLSRDYIVPLSLIFQLAITFIVLISIVGIISYKEAKKTSIKNLSKLLKI